MSKQIRFVFHLAKFEWRNLFNKRQIRLYDDVISLWTGLFNWFTPGLSHWEGWIADTDGDFTLPNYKPKLEKWVVYFAGTCYTSTMRGDNNGTVSRPASEVFTHPERWYYLEFEVTDESFEAAKAWADERVRLNKGYSKRDLLRFVMPLWMLKGLKIADPDREICSEHGEGWAIRLRFPGQMAVLLLLNIYIRSPRRLWRDLVHKQQVPTYSLDTGKMVYDEKGKKVK